MLRPKRSNLIVKVWVKRVDKNQPIVVESSRIVGITMQATSVNSTQQSSSHKRKRGRNQIISGRHPISENLNWKIQSTEKIVLEIMGENQLGSSGTQENTWGGHGKGREGEK